MAKEEIFGPIMSVMKFKTIDEAIERGNKTNYGLSAGIVTSSQDNVYRLANGIRAGAIFVLTVL